MKNVFVFKSKNTNKILLTFIFSLLISQSVFAYTPKEKLLCWDYRNSNALIPAYFNTSLNDERVDLEGRNSFIMDLDGPLTRWEWERIGFKFHYKWSVSECEDHSNFIFRIIDLKKVIDGKLKHTNLRYLYYTPENRVIRRVLRCQLYNDDMTLDLPVFSLF